MIAQIEDYAMSKTGGPSPRKLEVLSIPAPCLHPVASSSPSACQCSLRSVGSASQDPVNAEFPTPQ
jgi:hypothetical protein